MNGSRRLAMIGVGLLGLCAAAFVPAAEPSGFKPLPPTPAVELVEGTNFRTLAAPEPVATGARIEVLEVFSYGCVHCFDFETPLREWRMRAPKDVGMAYMPAAFNANFEMYARGYYAAEALGVAAKTHEPVFDAIWQGGLVPKDLDGLASLYQRLGVDRQQFLAAAKSPAVEAKLRDAGAKSERMKVEGTPTIYVDGKYQLLTTGAKSYEEVMARLDALVAKARADRHAGH